MTQQSHTRLKASLSSQLAKDHGSNYPVTPAVAMIFPAGEGETLACLFQQVPNSLGLTYLIMELPGVAGARDSQGPGDLHTRLEDVTSMSVHIPESGTVLERDAIYLLPATPIIRFERGRVLFSFGTDLGQQQQVADQLLGAIAAGFQGCGAAILSSEIASSAIMGLSALRDEGGYAIVLDDPAPADLSGSLPHFVDFFLSAVQAAGCLKLLAGYLRPELRRFEEPADEAMAVSAICRLVQEKKADDLTRFPGRDILRRIHRRMGVRSMETLSDYIACLHADEEELTHLYEELKTTLSAFWRDPGMKEVLLKEVLPVLLQSRSTSGRLRIWLPRCTEGHYAHSIAISILEYLEEKKIPISLQVFATDFNKQAIARARTGIYQENELNNLSHYSLKKYFVQKGNEWHLVKAVREICVFANHNLLKDPPFAHVDLVFALHVMTGLDIGIRRKLFRTFHYALNGSGILMLDRARPQDFPGELFHLRRELPAILAWKNVQLPVAPPAKSPVSRSGAQEADKLASYVPASFLVDEHFTVLRFYGNTRPYMRQPDDRPTLNLLQLIKDELVFELHDLFSRTEKEGQSVKKNSLPVGSGASFRLISLEMIPLQSYGRKWRLIIIREKSEEDGEVAKSADKRFSVKDLRIRDLEAQLKEMRGLLLAANEETHKIQETLQRNNEDTLSSNEELKSINEELHFRNRDLQASMEYIHTIIASIRRPIIALQDDLHIRIANYAFCHFFRLPQSIRGQHLYSIGRGLFDMPELRGYLDNWKSSKPAPVDQEVHHHFPVLGEKILRFNITPIPARAGHTSGIVLAIDDITEQKMVERFKDEFIGIASHELKTPATSIQAYSQLLYNELAKSEDQQSVMLVSRLNSQVTRLTRLAKDLLDVTRISQGQTGLNRSYFDINALIVEITNEIKGADPDRIVIAELPPAPRLLGDRERIAQVLVNILSNALKYSNGTNDIDLSTTVTATHISIAIRDSGIGMAPETLQKIFDRFYRSDDPISNHYPGIGLGLYISSEIVRRHGGSITVDSEKGKGSVFTVILPFS